MNKETSTKSTSTKSSSTSTLYVPPPTALVKFDKEWKECLNNLGRRDCGIVYWREKNWLLFVGGRNQDNVLLKSVLIYDMKTNKLLPKISIRLRRPKYHCSAIIIDGITTSTLYIIGGIGHGGWLNDIEIFDLDTIIIGMRRTKKYYTTILKTKLPKPIADATLTCYKDRYIYVIGGYDCSSVYELDTSSMKMLDIGDDTNDNDDDSEKSSVSYLSNSLFQQQRTTTTTTSSQASINSKSSGRNSSHYKRRGVLNICILPPMKETRLLPTVFVTKYGQLIVVGGYGSNGNENGKYLSSAEQINLKSIVRKNPEKENSYDTMMIYMSKKKRNQKKPLRIPASSTCCWKLLPYSYQLPGIMMAMGLVMNGNDLVLMGGRSEDGKWLPCLFERKFSTDKDWIMSPPGSFFPPYPGDSSKLHISMTVSPHTKQLWYVSADYKLYSLTFHKDEDDSTVESIHFGSNNKVQRKRHYYSYRKTINSDNDSSDEEEQYLMC